MNELELLKALKNNDAEALKVLYTTYKKPFYNFAKRYDISLYDVKDIYQDVILAFRNNVLKGHLDHLDHSLKTYLFSIGKHMIFKKFKLKQKLYVTENANDFLKERVEDLDTNLAYEFDNEQQRLLAFGFRKLGDKCREILHLFYYRGFTLDEIVDYMEYKNKDVAKSHKSRCIKKLKSLIQL